MTRAVLLFFMIFLFLCFCLASLKASTFNTAPEMTDKDVDREDHAMAASDINSTALESEGTSSLLRRLLRRRNPRAAVTCDKYPKICHMKGSPGHHCCNKRCVSLRKDNLNCGQCGKKCMYGEQCCRSKCVDILNSRTNCGGCLKKCKKGSYCRFGMCSYAQY